MSDDDLTIAYQLGVEDMRQKLHKQADEIERLRAAYEAMDKMLREANQHFMRIDMERNKLRAENETLRRDVKTAVMGDSAELQDVKRENEKLREALKPFAEKYTVKDDNLPNEHNALTLINVGDLRAARKALGETDD
jgi:chromosome segregation ATPase